MPEGLAAASVETVLACHRYEPRDSLLVSGSKEEGFVKFTAARQLGIPRPQSGVFCDFPRAHMVKACDADATFPGNVIEGGADLLVGASESHTKVAPGALSARDLEVEITVRKKDPATAFRNEGMAVFKLSPQRLYFCPCT